MVDKIFVSPQVKQIVIISKKHGKNELTHELRKHFGQDCFGKQYFAPNSPLVTFKLDLFNTFGNSKDFNIVLT